MNCKCIDEIDAKLKKHNCKLIVSLVFPKLQSSISLPTQLIVKQRGYKPPSVAIVFCPFCGINCTETVSQDEVDKHSGLDAESLETIKRERKMRKSFTTLKD